MRILAFRILIAIRATTMRNRVKNEVAECAYQSLDNFVLHHFVGYIYNEEEICSYQKVMIRYAVQTNCLPLRESIVHNYHKSRR